MKRNHIYMQKNNKGPDVLLFLTNLIRELKYYIDTGGKMPKIFKQLRSAYQITTFKLDSVSWFHWHGRVEKQAVKN